MKDAILYHLYGLGIFCMVPSLLAGAVGTLIHPQVGLIFFLGFFGFTCDLCFGKRKSDER